MRLDPLPSQKEVDDCVRGAVRLFVRGITIHK